MPSADYLVSVIHAGTRGGDVDSIFLPIAVALRLSHDPPDPANVSGLAYASSCIASASVMNV